MEMKMQLRLGVALLLALGWIAGNAPEALAHGGGGGGAVAMAGYALYGGGVIVGYFVMLWEIPKRIFNLIVGNSANKSGISKAADRTRARTESRGGK